MHEMRALGQGRSAAAPARDLHDKEPTIVIVGGGFSGVSVAIALLREPRHAAARVVVLEPRAELGAGVAYATRDYPYPLNVAAGQMSLDASRPDDFLEFARSQGIQATSGDYLPRQVYGEYLRARFDAAAADGRAAHRRARALQLRRAPDGGWDLWLDDGTTLRAQTVVLAPGNPPPATPPPCLGIAATDRYIHDPWNIGAHSQGKLDSVLLLGSGLTMIDAALRLAAIRPRVRRIHVLSRHGLLPLTQVAAVPGTPPADVDPVSRASRSIRTLLSALRAGARVRAECGGDWRALIGALRPQLPRIWSELSAAERARFLRHARAYWDIHRHRVPPGPLAAVRSLQHLGVLEVHAGRLESVREMDDVLEVQWRPRGAARTRACLVDYVVNCTGPDLRVTRNADPLIQALLSAGLIRPDPHELGIEVAADGTVIGRDGLAVPGLCYVGPWLRARDWEATAVPELREHAARLARALAARAGTTAG